MKAASVFAHSKWSGYLAVLVATLCWGTSGIFVKFIVAQADVSALALAFWRDLFTFLTLLIGVGVIRPSMLRVRRRDLPWLAALGANLGIFHVFWNLGVMLNGAAVATVQQAAMPVIVAVAAWIIWHESLGWNKIAAIILTFGGTVLVSGLDVLGQIKLTLPGLLVGLGMPLFYASWNLFSKKLRADYEALTILTYAFGCGALVLLPLQFFSPQPWPVPSSVWLNFAALIALSTIIPFFLYTFALRQLPASVATILAMTEIPIVSVYAYFLLDEHMAPTQVLGALLVVGGVLMLSWKKGRSDK